MKQKFKRIEAVLGSLPVFEASARLGSFTRAAEELKLTQPTVSHHIQTLELMLEAPLFRRRHNRIFLTSEGQTLADAVSLGLGHIEQAARDIAVRKGENALILACSFGFAHGWLMPRFSRLRQALDGYPVNLATTDWLKGFDRDTADLVVIWAGLGPSKHLRIPLFPEDVVPVCSPEYLARHPDLADQPQALLEHPLVHFDERDSQFMNWEKWFASQGVRYQMPSDAYRYSNFEFMLRAVADGEGVGLGWVQLIEEPLARQELVPVGSQVRNHDTAYSLECRRGGVPDSVLDRAIAWFREEST